MSQCIGEIWWILPRNELCMWTWLCQCIMKLFAKNDRHLPLAKIYAELRNSRFAV